MARTLRGNEATHIVVDEAAFVDPKLIEETLWPMLATTDGQMTLISTPNGHNAFWKFFDRGKKQDEEAWSRQAPSSESPRVSPRFLAAQKELVSERAFAVEYEAQFMDSEGAVFRSEAIDQCLTTETEEHRGPYLIGVDWARYSDYTVLIVLSGTRERARLIEMKRMTKTGWTEQIDILADIVARYPGARILCDGNAVGDKMNDDFRAACPKASLDGFVFTAQSKPKLIDNLVALMERGRLLIPPDPILLKELKAFHWINGKLEGANEHDDTVIALALAALNLPTENSGEIMVGKTRSFG
ncbi:MAG: terminase family protein [Fimbriimonas sp.]